MTSLSTFKKDLCIRSNTKDIMFNQSMDWANHLNLLKGLELLKHIYWVNLFKHSKRDFVLLDQIQKKFKSYKQ